MSGCCCINFASFTVVVIKYVVQFKLWLCTYFRNVYSTVKQVYILLASDFRDLTRIEKLNRREFPEFAHYHNCPHRMSTPV